MGMYVKGRHICHARGEDTKEKENVGTPDKPKFSSKAFWQLLKMGAGTFSGDLKEVNLNDPKRTVVFELEANNFEKDGKPVNYIQDQGYVPKDGEDKSGPLNIILPVVLGGGS